MQTIASKKKKTQKNPFLETLSVRRKVYHARSDKSHCHSLQNDKNREKQNAAHLKMLFQEMHKQCVTPC